MRTFGSTIVSAYIPVFFMKTFPQFQSQYALINAGIYTFLGFSSNILGGLISDFYERKKSYMAKANICMFGAYAAIPLTAIACFTSNFYLAIFAFALKILFSGGHFAPAVTMMQNATDSSNSGFVVSAYSFYAHISETFAPLIFSSLALKYNATAIPRVYGYLVFAAVLFGYGLSNIFYYRAGKEYKKQMEEKDRA